MLVLPHNLALFQLIGVWRPVNWSLGLKYFFYNIYTLIVLVMVFLSVFTEIIKLIGSYENIEQLLHNLKMLLTMVGNFAKAVNLVYNRQDIVMLLTDLVSSPCLPRNPEEQSIQSKYDRIIKLRTMINVILVGSSVGMVTMESIFCDISDHNLPFNAWYPFDVSDSYGYWIAWLHQALAHIYGAMITANYDVFVPALMLQSCAKFDILDYRLTNAVNKFFGKSSDSKCDYNERALREIFDCIGFHQKIIDLSNFANDIVSSVIFLQFSISTQVICVTVYNLSKTKIDDPYFPGLVIYLACMLVQLFLYCYAGSELTSKSEDVVKSIYCKANWYTSDISVQKCLLLMMLRCSHTVKFTCGNIIYLSIDSFSSVVDAIESSHSISDYADHSFIALTMIGICIKMGSIVKNRKEIAELMELLCGGSFKTRNKEEEEVLKSCETIMKWRTISFGIFVQMGTTNLIISSLFYLAPHRITITRLYLPWDTKTLEGYWIAWVLQAISRWFGGPVNVACDSLVSGVMYRASAQFQILAIRLKDLVKPRKSKNEGNEDVRKHESKIIARLVKEHLEIIQIISKLNDIFGFVIFMQYCVSSTVLCVTIFVFAEVKQFDSHCAMMITYTGCLYFQIYLLCSAGSEMSIQSINFAEYIYTCDWDELKIGTKKSLMLMMMRSHRPLKFTSWHMIELSIESFSQIVKFSYSAYNVLSQKK
ncbi:uncharacterized protein [Chelonus insularis]|uniref:uncharacterized protein n=1 Tax=Chelonus insularis TaxID=460826 RepID=UPI00158EFF99|nr:uncharacterized protein LOC118067379 [Chelonus insularis]